MTLDDEAPPPTKKFGRVLFVDLEQFLLDNKNPVDVMIDNKFDSNDDFIEKVSVINKTSFALALNSGTHIKIYFYFILFWTGLFDPVI